MTWQFSDTDKLYDTQIYYVYSCISQKIYDTEKHGSLYTLVNTVNRASVSSYFVGTGTELRSRMQRGGRKTEPILLTRNGPETATDSKTNNKKQEAVLTSPMEKRGEGAYVKCLYEGFSYGSIGLYLSQNLQLS